MDDVHEIEQLKYRYLRATCARSTSSSGTSSSRLKAGTAYDG
jgi:hypothetical protein